MSGTPVAPRDSQRQRPASESSPAAPHRASHRERTAAFLGRAYVERLIVVLIAINAVTLGLETWPPVMTLAGDLLLAADGVILAVFVAELALRLYALGRRFWRDPWNVFDFAVIGVALLPAGGPLAVLRAFRVLRLLRLLSAVPRMRFVVESVIAALPGLGSITLLLVLFFYVFAVIGTGLFGRDFPQWFGSLPASMFSLFQVMTLEGWADIARALMGTYPLAWLYFLTFILLATFTVLNLFIAIIVNAMQAQHAAADGNGPGPGNDRPPGDATVLELRRLREELAALRRALDQRPGRQS